MLLANAVHTLLLREQSPMPITRRRRANPPDEPENNNHAGEQTENAAEALKTEQPLTGQVEGKTGTGAPVTDYTVTPPFSSVVPPTQTQASNGAEQQNYTPPIEGGRRTARGELFRRPPQPPPVPTTPPPPSLQPPTHEIALPLGNLLHLAYNPGYTGADEAAACYFITSLKKVKPADALAVGIVAPLLLPMIAGTHVARQLVRLVSPTAKSVVYGALCSP